MKKGWSGIAIAVLLALVVGLVGCKETTDSANKIGVVVTILPLAEFVEKVGGDKVNITVMVPPGASPHTYEVTSSQMVDLSRAEMYAAVGSGVEFELVWMDQIVDANDKMLVVDCSEGVDLIEMGSDHQHDGEEEGHHDSRGLDPHIWMSPLNAKTMVQNICKGLVEVDPDNRTYYEGNRDDYLQELTQLDQDIRDGLSDVTSRKFIVYHPAFGYFANEYDLTMLPVEEEGEEPTMAGIAHVIDQAKENNIKVIFASPQFDRGLADVIAKDIGGRVVFIDPLARDYIDNLHNLLDELVLAME